MAIHLLRGDSLEQPPAGRERRDAKGFTVVDWGTLALLPDKVNAADASVLWWNGATRDA